jgi:hypothetical protein
VIGLSYFDLDLVVGPTFQKHNIVIGLSLFHMYIPYDKIALSIGTKIFDLLTLTFDLLFKNLT